MINKALIIPTGDELANGIIIDTDSPMIMGKLLREMPNIAVLRNAPVVDNITSITDALKMAIEEKYQLVVIIGGSGEGHLHSDILGKDYTHSSIKDVLDDHFSTKILGKNGHMWSELVIGKKGETLILNLPGPYYEAEKTFEAFLDGYLKKKLNLEELNKHMADVLSRVYYEKR